MSKNKDFILLKMKKFELEFVLLFLQEIPTVEKDSPRQLKNKKPSCNSLGMNLSRSFSHKVAIIHPFGSFCQIMTSCFPKRYKQRMMRRECSQKVPTNQFSTCQTALTLINPSARRRMKSVFPLKVQTTHTTISHFQGLVWLPRRRAYTVSDFYTSHLLKFYFKDDNDFAM